MGDSSDIKVKKDDSSYLDALMGLIAIDSHDCTYERRL